MATAGLGIIFVGVNWSLRGHAFAWSSLPALLLAALNFWIGVKLLQLRYWALILARIFALWLAVGFIALFASGRFVAGPGGLAIATWAELVVTAAIVITIFLPSVSKAIPAPKKPGLA